MAERFRIDLGYPSLFGSLSYDGTGITDGVVVYDISTQQLFYTGGYGGGGGGGGGTIDTGSFLINASVNSNTLTFTRGNNTTFDLIVSTGSSTTTDNYWRLIDNKIINSGSLNVIITSSLTIDQYDNADVFLIKKQGVTQVKINNEGVLTLMPPDSFPTAVTGGIIYKDNEYYFGFQ